MLMQILGALLTYLTGKWSKIQGSVLLKNPEFYLNQNLILGKFSCKIGIQSFSFAFPLNLSVPMTLVTLVSLCGFRDTCFKDTAFLKNFFPPYIFFECAQGNLLHDFIINEVKKKAHFSISELFQSIVSYICFQYGWVWFLWVLAQIWVTIHIWTPKFRRLEKGEVLFVLPMYSGLLVDQSLTLNRRRQEVPHYSIADDEGEEDEMDEIGGEAHKGFTGKEGIIHEEDSIPKIYACATMWHEIKVRNIGISDGRGSAKMLRLVIF